MFSSFSSKMNGEVSENKITEFKVSINELVEQGFHSHKGHAKRKLVRRFKQNVDYTIDVQPNGKRYNFEHIMLTPECSVAMKALAVNSSRSKIFNESYDNLIIKQSPCPEYDTISFIRECFNKYESEIQYRILGYKIDLYFPKLMIAVECDEDDHENRDPDYEHDRQISITRELSCVWFRFNPKTKMSDIISDMISLATQQIIAMLQ